MDAVTLSPAPGISAYLLDCTQFLDDARCQHALAALSPVRRQKALSCRLRADRSRSVAAGLALDLGLQAYGLREKDVRMEAGRDGKPFLPEHPELSFNLSHSGSLALAVFADRPVGCDIQQMRGARLSTAARWFHPSELHYLQAAQTPAETEARFYRLWTLKESYAKATGRGLLLPLQSFAVDLSSGQPKLCGCRLFELRCPDGYYAACCVLD